MVKKLLTIILLCAFNFLVLGQTKWSFEFCGGVPYNIPAYIKIHQSGFDDIKISNAQFYTEPFALPPYWDWRFCRIKNDKIFEIEAIHQKLYLSNKPQEIRRFSISHGFNMFFLNYGRIKKGNYFLRTGLGAVFTHPETEIRGYVFEDKGAFLNTTYYLSGPAINVSIGKRWYLMKRLYLNTEVKSTVAYVKVPVALGYAKIFTTSIQIVFGLGFDFISK